MSDPSGNVTRKQLLLARSTLYRLRLRHDAVQLRQSMAGPARGLALVKYIPVAVIAIRLLARGRSAAVMPSLLGLVSVAASALLGRRGR